MTADLKMDRSAAGVLRVLLAGDWIITDGIPSPVSLENDIAGSGAQTLVVDAHDLGKWDSGLLTFLIRLKEICARSRIALDTATLPRGVNQLLALAGAIPEVSGARHTEKSDSFMTRVGNDTVDFFTSAAELFEFIGEVILSFFRFIRGTSQVRFRDIWLNMQECGAQALPVVTLISVLTGLILAFVGALQLKMFGAEIYVANLVAIGMAREMGALMPGIIMAGRTGASFAAQLGTMQVNEEIDALRTMGISPIDFLVLPRTLAMILMMPLLCIYANFLGIMGGQIVSTFIFHMNFAQYFNQTAGSVVVSDFGVGIVKSAIFGVLVAGAGCLRGIRCGRSSAAVGAATTSAVVTGIVSIIIADSIITVITSIMGI